MTKEIDGKELYHGFVRGGQKVIEERVSLDQINVFPVPDSDTGHNMATTMKAMIERVQVSNSIGVMSRRMAQAAISNSRGNSGIIFAQFLEGLSQEIQDREQIGPVEFAKATESASKVAYQSISEPVEGTIITVMRKWANALKGLANKKTDFTTFIEESMVTARQSLQETTQQLSVLQEKNVVDAGAKGFVLFLEGFVHFLRDREPLELETLELPTLKERYEHPVREGNLAQRYCTEFTIEGEGIDRGQLENIASNYGDSLIIATRPNTARMHIHTNSPAQLSQKLRLLGKIVDGKVDDMKRQQQALREESGDIALVTDSACDLPLELLDRYNIHLIPLSLSFNGETYFDKITINPKQFYSLLKEKGYYPTTSQPSPEQFKSLYSFLRDHYQHVISLHLSAELSGTYQVASSAAEEVDDKNITVVNTRQLSTSLGLIVLKIAKAIEAGQSISSITDLARSISEKSKILVSVKDIQYMIRGGRVSPLKGFFARMLHLIPIISLDEEGNSILYEKSFTQASNNEKIVSRIEEQHRSTPIESYAIGHVHAEDQAEELSKQIQDVLGQPPQYTMNISPLIGSHAGIGAVSVSYMTE